MLRMWTAISIASAGLAAQGLPMRPAWYDGAVAYAPDGQSVAVALPGRVDIWDIGLKEIIQSFGTEEVQTKMRLAWSPDSRSLLLCTGRTLYLWDGRMGKPPRFQYQPAGGMVPVRSSDARGWDVISVAWSPNGHRFAVATGLEVVILDSPLFDILSKVAPGPIAPFPRGSIFDLAPSSAGLVRIPIEGAGYLGFSSDGKMIAGVGDRLVRVWDTSSGQKVREMALPAGTNYDRRQTRWPILAWSPVGPLLATCDTANVIEVWDAASGDLRLKLDGGPSTHSRLAWSRKGDRLALATEDAVTIFDTNSGAQVLQTQNAIDVYFADFSADLDRGVLASNDGTLELWPPLAHDAGDPSFLAGKAPAYARWGEDNRLLLWGDDGEVQIWDVAKLQRLTRFPADVWGSQSVTSQAPPALVARMTANSQLPFEIVAADAEGKILLRGSSPGNGEYRIGSAFGGAQMPIYAVAFSPDHSFVAALGGDSLWTWDAHPGAPPAPKRFPVAGTEMAWTSDRTVLVSGLDGSVTEFDLTASKTIWRFAPPRATSPSLSPMSSARLAPDGKSFLSAGWLWRRAVSGAPPERVAQFAPEQTFWTHDGAGLFRFSTNGIVSTTLDLYAASTGKKTDVWRVNGKLAPSIRWIAPSPDGHRLALLAADGTTWIVRILRPPGE